MRADNLIQFQTPSLPRLPASNGRISWENIKETLSLWSERSRSRNELRLQLGNDERFFYDIGVSRATVFNESQKWFWQA